MSDKWTKETPYGILSVAGNEKQFSFGDVQACRAQYVKQGFGGIVPRKLPSARGMPNFQDDDKAVYVGQWIVKPSDANVKSFINDHYQMYIKTRK